MSTRRRSVRGLIARSLACMLGVGLGAQQAAEATWSIIIVDVKTGEIAIGSATCLTGFDLQLNASIVVVGIGAAAAQSSVDSTGLNRVFIHDQMLRATDPAQIITMLAGFDASHQSRQYGIVDLRNNGRATTFTGTGAGLYRGGRTGRVQGGGPTGGDLVYAVQGNVLTGAPVIDAAVGAIEDGPGDLPERLMRAMEAARLFGGDGRCSCNPSNPTACGAPPKQFDRSAYIGYMIVSRTGDRDGCNGLYRLNAALPSAIVAADINRDGAPELITCNQNSATVGILTNTIASGVATFSLPALYPCGTTPRDLVAADFSGDTFADVATANFGTDNVTVLRGQANGTLSGRVDYPVGDGPVSLVAADFDGDGDNDIAVINQLGISASILVNDGTSVFTTGQTVPLPTAPAAMAFGDLDNDGDQDIVVAVNTTPNSSLVILRNQTPAGGSVSFAVEAPISVGRGVSAVAVGNLNADARRDLVALAVTDSQINVLLQNAAGFDPPVSYPFAAQGIGLAIADVDGDTFPDIVSSARSAPQRLGYLPGNGSGAFQQARYYNFNLTPGEFTLADLDNDGDLDFAAPLTSNNFVLTVQNFGHGVFNNGPGCAAGTYYMDFNVANVPTGAPDPVPILRDMFDRFRMGLLADPDAIRSTAVFTPPRVRADGVNSSVLDITLRDWQDQPVAPLPGRTVQVVAAPGQGMGTTIGAATPDPLGVFHVAVTTGTQTGTARFVVSVQDSPGAPPVFLMPQVALTLLNRADWNLDGVVNSADFFAFLDAFLSGAAADFNHDGATNSQDYFDYLAAFFAP